jgi:hypothetical protein
MTQNNEYEREVREFLQGTTAHVHAPADLYERVRTGAARRRSVRNTTVALTVAIAVVGASWVGVAASNNFGSSVGQPVRSPTTAASSPTACPRTMPGADTLPSDHPGMDALLVPGQPSGAIACAYTETWTSGSNSPATKLTGATGVTGDRLTALVSALREHLSPYPLSCPFVTVAREVYLEFAYADAGQVDVEITLSCPSFTNGVLTRSPAQHYPMSSVITQLAAATQ